MNTNRASTTRLHVLKSWPQFFDPVWAGRKTFEIRFNDRDFKAGHLVVLKEFATEPDRYSGREIHGRITYVTELLQQDGYVVFGINDVRHVHPK